LVWVDPEFVKEWFFVVEVGYTTDRTGSSADWTGGGRGSGTDIEGHERDSGV
jgi:hypothetical protein